MGKGVSNVAMDSHSGSSRKRHSIDSKEKEVSVQKKSKTNDIIVKATRIPEDNKITMEHNENGNKTQSLVEVNANGKGNKEYAKVEEITSNQDKSSVAGGKQDRYEQSVVSKESTFSRLQAFEDFLSSEAVSSDPSLTSKHASTIEAKPSNEEEVEDVSTMDVAKLFSALQPIDSNSEKLVSPLSNSELGELEAVLEFSLDRSTDSTAGWRNDWSGNLAYIDKEICNPLFRVKNLRIKQAKSGTGTGGGVRGKKANERLTLLQWATLIEENGAAVAKANAVRRMVKLLLRHVCTYSVDQSKSSSTEASVSHVNHKKISIPQSVVKLLSSVTVETSPLTKIEEMIRRASYDPQILKEDGWTVERSNEAQGATGGAFRIGEKIRYEGSDGVVIAYIHDADIGDLWKAIWIEDYISFDLEAEELLLARQKWEKIYLKKPQESKVFSSLPVAKRKTNVREAAVGSGGSIDFTIKGIEFGIVLASSYSKGARPGVYWPARVMHASEVSQNGKRNSSKSQKKLDVVFLAPYWNALDDVSYTANKVKAGPPLSENEESVFNSNPLFQFETVEANDDTVKQYPFVNDENAAAILDIEHVLMSFRFTGLPKSAFPRFVDACRLASSLREYAKSNLDIVTPSSESNASHRATAALFEAHPLAVQVPLFPPVILHLPFAFILQQLPNPKMSECDGSQRDKSCKEPVVQIASVVDSMKPPRCWCADSDQPSQSLNGKRVRQDSINKLEPSGKWAKSSLKEEVPDRTSLLSRFVVDFPLVSETFDRFHSIPEVEEIIYKVHMIVRNDLHGVKVESDDLQEKLRTCLKSVVTRWSGIKSAMEDTIALLPLEDIYHKQQTLAQWRQAAERIYRHIITETTKSVSAENSTFSTLVITDSRCNEHRTSNQCLERRVRLPAALKAAKKAGASVNGPIRLIHTVDDSYIDYVEKKVLPKAHTNAYLRRMKGRCTTAKTNNDILIFTEDSDGNGGDDTRGSQGSWLAAVCGVAAAVSACDRVVRGECVNAFCVTRPPGHHAGRSLHPMKAVSNGFCLLNPVACAAIHATTPIALGGLGLRRVCVIDFDVHHGNGTQDILASTYDPRFLYISMHAGGAHINGMPDSGDPSDEPYGLAKNPNMSGIYPGRCGDTSPHDGVLNIPLGAKVTSHGVGTALLQRVKPAVESFSPDLIMLSAGFDAHKNDPMGLGCLSAEDFGNITDVACQLALKCCSGRVVSILEGGYGVPCCRPQQNTFLPPSLIPTTATCPVFTPSTSVAQQPTPVEANGNLIVVSENGEATKVVPPETSATRPHLPPPPQQQQKVRPQPSRLLDLDETIPASMDDQVPYPLQVRLEKCHTEGFVECVYEHVSSLARCTDR